MSSGEKNVHFLTLHQLAHEVGGPDLAALRQAFQQLEQSVAGLGSFYEAQRATDLISQLKQIVQQVMSEIEPVCKEFEKVGSEEADYWKKFATTTAEIPKA